MDRNFAVVFKDTDLIYVMIDRAKRELEAEENELKVTDWRWSSLPLILMSSTLAILGSA